MTRNKKLIYNSNRGNVLLVDYTFVKYYIAVARHDLPHWQSYTLQSDYHEIQGYAVVDLKTEAVQRAMII